MRGIKGLGLCIVAVFALCGLMAAVAQAEALPKPVWAECGTAAKVEGKYTGKYTDKTCSTEASEAEITEGKKNKYELKEGVGKNKAFKGKAVVTEVEKKPTVFPELIVEAPQGHFAIKCEGGGKDEGKASGKNVEEKVTSSFTKCSFLGKVCTSAGAKKGEIKVTGMKGELGYIEEYTELQREEKEVPKVGIRLEAEAGDGVSTEFDCEGTQVEAKIFGEVIGEETKVKKVGKTYEEVAVNTVSKESEAVYEPGKFYGKHEFDHLEYEPVVNIVGWGPEEREKIVACEAHHEGEPNCEEEWPAHVLKGVFCGGFIEEELKVKCTPEEGTYTGLKARFINKGEPLEIKI